MSQPEAMDVQRAMIQDVLLLLKFCKCVHCHFEFFRMSWSPSLSAAASWLS